MAWLEHAPLGLIWPTLSVVLLLAMALGYAAGRITPRRPREGGSLDGIGFLLSAALALLGLLIAFTFSMAATRFETRRDAVLHEANAVGTAYLRYQLLDEPGRGAISRDLLAWLEARQAFFAAGADPSAIERAEAQTGEVSARIWTELTGWTRAHPGNTANIPLLQATNEMFDLAASDRAHREARVPITILRAIMIYAVIAAVLLGQSLAVQKSRHPLAAATLFVLVALAIALILDLDRPATGTITVSTAPFDRAAQSIRTMEAAR
jgi:hypothetical protein